MILNGHHGPGGFVQQHQYRQQKADSVNGTDGRHVAKQRHLQNDAGDLCVPQENQHDPHDHNRQEKPFRQAGRRLLQVIPPAKGVAVFGESPN